MSVMTQARKLVLAEETAEREVRVTATAQRLQASASQVAAAADRARRIARADAAQDAFMWHAPTVTLAYEKVRVTITLRMGVEALMVVEAIKRAERVLRGAFSLRLGHIRAAAMTGAPVPDEDMTKLVNLLRGELAPAARLDAVTVEIAK
jgi:hypothetical protein